MDYLIENEWLVNSVINNCHGYYDRDDLYQVGMIGLINASRKYDKNSNVKFSTYAYKYILGEVTKYMRENNGIKISRDIIKLKSSINKTKELLRQKLEREPTTSELSVFLEIDEKKIIELESFDINVQSLDYSFEDNSSLYNLIKVEDRDISPTIMDLRDEINKLPSEERRLLYSRYFVNLTQKETSEELGISQVQVSRKESKILKKLKTRL